MLVGVASRLVAVKPAVSAVTTSSKYTWKIKLYMLSNNPGIDKILKMIQCWKAEIFWLWKIKRMWWSIGKKKTFFIQTLIMISRKHLNYSDCYYTMLHYSLFPKIKKKMLKMLQFRAHRKKSMHIFEQNISNETSNTIT